MIIEINVLMNASDMFKKGGNDLTQCTKEHLLRLIYQNGFGGICENCIVRGNTLDSLDETTYENLCNSIDNDINEESKFWTAFKVFEDSLYFDYEDMTYQDDNVISYSVEADIDIPKLMQLYLGEPNVLN